MLIFNIKVKIYMISIVIKNSILLILFDVLEHVEDWKLMIVKSLSLLKDNDYI